jgi:hypothetical protein
MADDFASFRERVSRISPQYSDVFGNGTPGMGASAASVTQRLQREVAQLGQLYCDPAGSLQKLTQQAKMVESLLLTAQTLSSLSQEEADSLITELYTLVDRKE